MPTGAAASRAFGLPPFAAAGPFAALAVAHLCVALVYVTVLGLDITANPRGRGWDWFWQTVPADLLRDDALRSIWYMHSQPPVFNLYAAAFFKSSIHQPLQWMHCANIALGALLSGMMYSVLLAFTRSRPVSWLGASLLLLNPALYLYEAFILYDLLSAFLVVLTIYPLARYQRTRRVSCLWAFVCAVNLLVLTRSLYHLAFLVMAVVLGCLLASRQPKRYLAVALVVSTLSAGWYVKNYLMFGSFGSSTWMGASLWKVVAYRYPDEKLRALAAGGVVPRVVVEVPVFDPPSAYRPYMQLETSAVPVLSRDDRHNVGYVAISRVYFRAAIGLLTHDPRHYLANVWAAYMTFTRPTSQYVQLRVNARKIAWHEWVSANLVQGQLLTRRLSLGDVTLLILWLPAGAVAYVVLAVRTARRSPARWRRQLNAHCGLVFTFLTLAYTTVVVLTMELGENHRLRFMIEQPLWAFLLAVSYLSGKAITSGARRRLAPGPSRARERRAPS